MKIRTAEEMMHDIRIWEVEAGEGFLDSFDGSFNEANFMFWCLGKGYTNTEKFNLWQESYENNNHYGGEFLFDEEEEFALIKEPVYSDGDEKWEDAYNKAIYMLAEFLTSNNTYQRRADEFFIENSQV